jgi:hypothetical protein
MKKIKSKLPFKTAKKKFIEFLNKNKIRNKYFVEFMFAYKTPLVHIPVEEYWDHWATKCSQYNWIDGIIVFFKTDQGIDFWNKYNELWKEELNKLNECSKK